MDNPLTPAFITHRDRIYLSGITAQHNLGIIGDQMREVLEILDARLAEAGTD